jgi:hypothetical protein
MKTIVFVRIFNDFDHALPIIDYLTRYKGQVVTIYGIGEEYKKCNKHISYLENILSNKVIPFEDEFYSNNHKILLKFLEKIGVLFKSENKIIDLSFDILLSQIRRVIYYLASGSVENFISKLPKKTVIMADFGTEGQFPYKYIIRKSQKKGILAIAYLHGYYIWTNLNVLRVNKSKLPPKITTFINKFIFGKGINDFYDKYLVAPNAMETHFKSNLYLGFDKFERVVGLGIPRFTYEWINNFALKDFSSNLNRFNDNKINVALFLSSETYEVDSHSLKEAVNWMVDSELINLIIKPHPRAGLSGIDQNNLSVFSKVSDLNSSEIINWADVGIVYGSSIALEMIVNDVVVVVPRYIDKNRTIIEEYKVCNTVDSFQQFVNFFNGYHDKSTHPDKNNVENFIKEIIYGGSSSYEELMDKYTYFIK